jgi:hypothetical protein
VANRFRDGFDWFPAGQSLLTRQRLWAANEFFGRDNGGGLGADVVTGRFNFGKALALSGSLGGFFGHDSGYVVPIGVNIATGFYGMAVYVDSLLPSACRPVLGFYDAVSNAHQINFSFEQNGVLKVWLGAPGAGNGTLLATSSAGAFQEDQWFHCEASPLIANSGGTFEIRINTVPKVQLTGADTQNSANAYFDSVFLGAYTTNNNVGIDGAHPAVFDDMFVHDASGATNNTWGGNLRVKTQFMIANGATDNFSIGGTAPAATQWQSVLNQILDDGQFVYSPTVGDIDLFTPDPNLNSPIVRALQVRMALRQDDATQRVARALLRIGATNYLGAVDQYTNQTYTFYKDAWELNPATGVTFTGAEVNGLQAGVKVQA